VVEKENHHRRDNNNNNNKEINGTCWNWDQLPLIANRRHEYSWKTQD
jgi:hypothetical protein